jgi:hypothetical protein
VLYTCKNHIHHQGQSKYNKFKMRMKHYQILHRQTDRQNANIFPWKSTILKQCLDDLQPFFNTFHVTFLGECEQQKQQAWITHLLAKVEATRWNTGLVTTKIEIALCFICTRCHNLIFILLQPICLQDLHSLLIDLIVVMGLQVLNLLQTFSLINVACI